MSGAASDGLMSHVRSARKRTSCPSGTLSDRILPVAHGHMPSLLVSRRNRVPPWLRTRSLHDAFRSVPIDSSATCDARRRWTGPLAVQEQRPRPLGPVGDWRPLFGIRTSGTSDRGVSHRRLSGTRNETDVPI